MATEIISWADAQARGLKRYFTGKPCKRGHIAERAASNGLCFECASLKNKANRAKDPEKHRERFRKWKAENPEKMKAATDSWRARNPDKVKAQKARKYQRHRDKILAKNKEWGSRNKEKVLAKVLAWAAANPEKTKINRAKWTRNNPEKVRAIVNTRRARRINAEGKYTSDDVARIYKAQKGKCAYCRVSLKNRYHVDHIIALSRSGSNWPSNIQLCCESCNSRKHARDPIEFAQSTGRLL